MKTKETRLNCSNGNICEGECVSKVKANKGEQKRKKHSHEGERVSDKARDVRYSVVGDSSRDKVEQKKKDTYP